MNIAPYIAILASIGSPVPQRVEHAIRTIWRDHGLVTLLQAPGLILLGTPDSPHISLGRDLLVWGYLFDRMSCTRVCGPQADRPAPAGLASMLEKHWGGYVAFHATRGTVEVLRDPSGEVPCYHGQAEGVRFVTSRPELLFAAGLLKPVIDWTILTQALAFVDLRPARTALRSIDELMPGMLASFAGATASLRCAWSPWHFASREAQVTNSAAAIEIVREAVTGCVTAWARCFRSPVVEISGGLDSSIVAAILASASPTASAITITPGPGDPDEVPYARSVAERSGLPLKLFELSRGDVDLLRSSARDLPRPAAHAFLQAMDRPVAEHARTLGADAFFSGGGGDNVFCNLQSALPLLDRLASGDLAGATRTMNDLAQMAEVGIWQVLANAARRSIGRRAVRWRIRTDFLAPEAMGRLPFPTGHPWVDRPSGTLPGKAAHVRLLIAIQNHLEGLERLRHAPIVSPLLSQPVMEACLSVPSWLWCDGGNNRAVARAAFTDTLPNVIVERRSKGRFDAFVAGLVEANRGTLREMLLDGLVARRSILDREAVAHALEERVLPGDVAIRLHTLADAEAWARSWQNVPDTA